MLQMMSDMEGEDQKQGKDFYMPRYAKICILLFSYVSCI